MVLKIRRAKAGDCTALTDISFSSKRYWGYPEEYFVVWEPELTITAEYIKRNSVYVVEEFGEAIGYLSICEVKSDFWADNVFVSKGFWLDHVFILPNHIKRGIGKYLVEFAKAYCRPRHIESLKIFSDAKAKGFFEKQGAVCLGESPSSVKGISVSLFELPVD